MKFHATGRLALALFAAGGQCLSVAPIASAGGGNSANAKLCQKGGYANLYNASTGLAFTSQGACVSYGAHGNTYSSLTVTPSTSANGATVSVSGFGLQPGSTVTIHYTSTTSGSGFALIDANSSGGVVGSITEIDCPATLSVSATGTTSAGATITTPTVTATC